MVLGHEPAGTVVKTGAGVTGWQPGDRVALEPALYCYHCEFCRSGHHNVCASIRFLSNPGHPGFFREFVNLPVANLLAIPPELSLELATIVEPLAVAIHSMRFAAVQPGETVAVFGAGPIGLLTIACLKVAGAGRIWAIDPAGASPRTCHSHGSTRYARPLPTRRRTPDPGRYRRPRSGLRHRLRRERGHHQRRHPRGTQRGTRRADRDSLRGHGPLRGLAHAPQGTRHLQRAPLQPRVARRARVCSLPAWPGSPRW